jgi:hypothetical protein
MSGELFRNIRVYQHERFAEIRQRQEDQERLVRLRKELNAACCPDDIPEEAHEAYRREIAQRLYWINQAHP